jgi:glycosyltransferase involved in cell wall biosynthesis
MISRVLKNKGALEYFKAAELLKIKYPEWQFIIIGSMDYNSPDKIDYDIIEHYKKNKIIIFKGYKKNIRGYLSKTEIFCLPSHREGMPKATLEALSAGVPVVTTDAVGCRESIMPNKNGLLSKSQNYKSLAKEIEKLIASTKLRKKFSKNAKIYAKKNFSINDVSKKIYKVYENLMYE